MANAAANAPVIIKKVKKGGHDGHHGGAWKVAYADFVTAMMAFFLLLWLLNATTAEQKQGIADYFTPASVSKSFSGSGGVMGGQTMTEDGAMQSDRSSVGMTIALPADEESLETQDEVARNAETPVESGAELARDPDETTEAEVARLPDETTESEVARLPDETAEAEVTPLPNEPVDAEVARLPHEPVDAELQGQLGESPFQDELSEQELQERLAEIQAEEEQDQFEAAAQALREAIQGIPELQDLAEHLMIDQTPEGLRIQIVDRDKRAMFPIGSAEMHDHTRQLMRLVYDVIKDLPKKVKIKGHTDSTPYRTDTGYSNWELSTDRANASRRALLELGLPMERIEYVAGRAAQEPLLPDDPTNPRNRRISIILLREAKQGAQGEAKSEPEPFVQPSIIWGEDAE